jgi:hypothetical protein
MKLSRWRSIMIMITIAGVTGCQSSGSGAAGQVSVASSNPVTSASQEAASGSSSAAAAAAMPLGPYLPSAQMQAQLDDMQLRLAAQCMNSAGFSYPVIVEDPMSYGADPGSSAFYVFGATDMTVAAKYGYHETDVAVSHRHTVDGGKGPKLLSLPTAEVTQLGKCNDQVSTQVGNPEWKSLIQNLSWTAWQESKSDPRVVAGFQKWSACMAQKGFNYDTPLDALVGEPAGSNRAVQWNAPNPSQLEIGTAETDVSCKTSTGLLSLWKTVLVQDQQALVTKNLPGLRAGLQEFNANIKREQQLLAQES